MPNARRQSQMREVSMLARAAEARGDDAMAGEEWRRYRLIKDASRDPDELLAEGVLLSIQANELAAIAR